VQLNDAIQVRISEDAAVWVAASIARRLAAAIRRRGRAALAVSGGSTAPPMLDALARHDLASTNGSPPTATRTATPASSPACRAGTT
jgi:6-phosphogluconolactonase